MIKTFLIVFSVLMLFDQYSCQTQEFIRWQTLRYKNIPGNFDNNASVIIPFGVSHDRGRLFVSVPRRNPGVAAVLSIVELNGTPPYTNPELIPYPNFDIQSITQNPQANPQKIVSVYRTRVDRCGFLWFADTGVLEFRGNRQVIQRPSLWAINLNNDQVAWRYEFPVNVVPNDGAGLIDVTIDDDDCQNVFAYLPDIFNNALVVVDTKNANSWRFTHNYLRANPFEGEFDVDGFRFQLGDGIFSIALSQRRPDGFKIAFFHPLASLGEFVVSTKVLRSEAAAARRFHGNDFRFIGYSSNRGDHFFDVKNRILFSAEMQKNGISCWDPKGKDSMRESQVRLVAQNNQTMIYPACVNIDSDNNLWVLSNRLPRVIFGTIDFSLFNFNIFKLNPDEIIKGTECARVSNNRQDAEIGIRGDFPNKESQYVGGGLYASSADAAIKFDE